MKYIQNPGLINLAALRIMGVSAKTGDNPIGKFGTGLKFAIAGILRNGGKITLYRGKSKYTFSSKKRKMRGQQFNLVYMNDEQLGFTTDLGKHWEPWMLFREIYSNMLDEGGEVSTALKPGHTSFLVEDFPAFEDLLTNNEVFLTSKSFYTDGSLEFHAGESKKIYCNGVHVGDLRSPFFATINVVDWAAKHVGLTEDRTLRYTGTVENWLTRTIVSSKSDSFIRAAISQQHSSIVNILTFNKNTVDYVSDQFKDTVKEMVAEREPIAHGVRAFYQVWIQQKGTVALGADEMVRAAQVLKLVHSAGYNTDAFSVAYQPIIAVKREDDVIQVPAEWIVGDDAWPLEDLAAVIIRHRVAMIIGGNIPSDIISWMAKKDMGKVRDDGPIS